MAYTWESFPANPPGGDPNWEPSTSGASAAGPGADSGSNFPQRFPDVPPPTTPGTTPQTTTLRTPEYGFNDALVSGATLGLSNNADALAYAIANWTKGKGDFSDLYHQGMTERLAQQDAYGQAHPWADLGANALGTTVIGAPKAALTAATAVAPALRRVGTQMLTGMGLGAVPGAIQGATSTPTPEVGPTATGAIGGAIGGLLTSLPVLRAAGIGLQDIKRWGEELGMGGLAATGLEHTTGLGPPWNWLTLAPAAIDAAKNLGQAALKKVPALPLTQWAPTAGAYVGRLGEIFGRGQTNQ